MTLDERYSMCLEMLGERCGWLRRDLDPIESLTHDLEASNIGHLYALYGWIIELQGDVENVRELLIRTIEVKEILDEES